jgi:hypothetical protein
MLNAEAVSTARQHAPAALRTSTGCPLLVCVPLVRRSVHNNRIRLQAVEKELKRRQDRAALARGEKLEPEQHKPYGDDDEGMQGGIIIPLAPFGIPKYDNGERFDLKVPSCVPLLILHARGLSHAC